MSGHLALFRCDAYACRLSRRACLDRQAKRRRLDALDSIHVRATGKAAKGAACYRCVDACEAGAETRALAAGWGEAPAPFVSVKARDKSRRKAEAAAMSATWTRGAP